MSDEAKMNNKVKIGLSFPLLVIAGALVIGGIGYYAIYSIHERSNASIRDSALLDPVEGKLIEEVQRKTSDELMLKDEEIAWQRNIIALQQRQIDVLLARKLSVHSDPGETAKLDNDIEKLNKDIEEREKKIEALEADKIAIMKNSASSLPAGIPVQPAIALFQEQGWPEIPVAAETDQAEQGKDAAVNYEQTIDRLKETINEKNREIQRLSAQVEALRISREGMNE
jgi:uncharacterized coiled-coil protein SlyX